MQFRHLFALATAFGIATPVIASRCLVVVLSDIDGKTWETDWERCDPPVRMLQFGGNTDPKPKNRGYRFWVKVDADCRKAVRVAGRMPEDSHLLGKAEKTKPALLWCNLELNFSIIGGNFPTLGPFNRSLFHPVRSTSGTGCRCWSQHFARRKRTLRARRSGAVVRSLDAGASLGDLDFGSATAASSLPRDRTGRGSGERILMAGREQHRARKQERQPQVDEAGVNGPWEQTETRGSAKPNGLDCHENSKAVQNQP
ncbi:hypothetical protein PpBr36_02736 [Pyricularia pennisetigena]|uniref:hypothetical protein n=1 Tax=Pyricularia pennisetigena TaxID=1578925 RepID=UPI00114EB150|nr:hypothetical protein PpBr36_02736 [Pyricularia pennisetigena]TLS30611.1 hypothetical protein PpBr36_02736 [Pyricularia pennisetigena]